MEKSNRYICYILDKTVTCYNNEQFFYNLVVYNLQLFFDMQLFCVF